MHLDGSINTRKEAFWATHRTDKLHHILPSFNFYFQKFQLWEKYKKLYFNEVSPLMFKLNGILCKYGIHFIGK